jgi:hypothetical protein
MAGKSRKVSFGKRSFVASRSFSFVLSSAIAIAVAGFAVFLMNSQALAVGGGAGGATGSFGVPIDLLMPSPPRNVTATAGDRMATVNFEPPKTDGGSPVTEYMVISHPEGMKAKGKKSPIAIRGLTNGKAYTFTLTATNSVGTGLASEPSNCVTPGE